MEHSKKKEAFTSPITLVPTFDMLANFGTFPKEAVKNWNLQGEVNEFGSKNLRWIISSPIPIMSYVILRFIAKKEESVILANKYGLTALLMFMITVICLFLIVLSVRQITLSSSLILTTVGIYFILMGYALRFVKRNYFLGIRTRWTLRDHLVWDEVHSAASLFWVLGGFAITVVSLIFSFETTNVVCLTLGFLLMLTPIIHSYLHFKEFHKVPRIF